LFDTVLNDGSGKELCERIREFDQLTPIIFYSGDHPASLGASAKLDIQDYVMKPKLEGLRRAIFRAMNTVKPKLAAI
jgi:two-component SAPR family response regulator